MENNTNPLVSVCMITYNHEPYIKQALDSVLMQNCDFQYEIIIGEDCSNDDTLLICQEYSNRHHQIRLLPSRANLGMIQNFTRTLTACKGKYIAILEGDDYWSDPFKLKKQVDFLETNEEYGLVHTAYTNFVQKLNSFRDNIISEVCEGYVFERLLIDNKIATLTVMAKRKLIIEAIDSGIFEFGFKVGDYPLWLEISTKNKIGFINEVTSVYRVLTESASHTQDINKQIMLNRSVHNLRKLFVEKHKLYHLGKYLDVCFFKELLFFGYKFKLSDISKEGYEGLKNLSGYNVTLKDHLVYLGSRDRVVNHLLTLIFSIKNIKK